MMNEIDVSIIVPIYNVETYLRQCLDSLINQTLKGIELICVNDGSTDNSLAIIQEYAQRDNRVVILSKDNGGLSSARNAGMKIAKGKYIGFVDSDDWVDFNMFEKLYNKGILKDADMVMCAVNCVNEMTQEIENTDTYFQLSCFTEKFNDIVFNHRDTKNFLFDISVTAWNKIYRRELIEKYNIIFPEGLIFEDNPFFYETYFKAENVIIVRESLYYYRMNRKNSIIKKTNKKFFDVVKIMDIIEETLINQCLFEDYKNDFLKYKIDTILYRFSQIQKDYQKEFFYIIKRNFDKIDLSQYTLNLTNSYYIDVMLIQTSNYWGYRFLKFSKRILKEIRDYLHLRNIYKSL
jgi:glycosyltransferase involved in cell wall biosynthesis